MSTMQRVLMTVVVFALMGCTKGMDPTGPRPLPWNGDTSLIFRTDTAPGQVVDPAVFYGNPTRFIRTDTAPGQILPPDIFRHDLGNDSTAAGGDS